MVKQMMRIVAAVVAVVLLVGAVPAQALTSDEIKEEIEELEKESQQLREQMDELEQQLTENYEQMEEMVAQKSAIDQQVVLLSEQVDNINSQIISYGFLIADQQEALDAARIRLEELNGKYKERIRAMEEEGELSYWSVLFRSRSFADLLDRLNMVREIAAADRQRLAELEAAADAVAEAKQTLEDQKTALEATRSQLHGAQLALEQKREQADKLLQKMVAREEEFQHLLEESEEKQTALMEELAKKEDAYDKALYEEWLATYVPPVTQEPTPEIPKDDSNWITPVPYYTLTSPFGMRLHPILGIYRMHNGIDMACAAGTPIYASRGGLVEVAGYQADGAGNYIQLNHGDGFRSIYMHMTNYIVKQGEYVAPGQIIGYVGNTGLSKGNHLHFGISYNGAYVNPVEYIG